MTGNEPNTSITTTSPKLSSNQDLPTVLTPTTPEVALSDEQLVIEQNTITPFEYADHMELSIAQLETVTLMLSILDQTADGQTPTD